VSGAWARLHLDHLSDPLGRCPRRVAHPVDPATVATPPSAGEVWALVAARSRTGKWTHWYRAGRRPSIGRRRRG
jgi:hypothetical protein